MSSFLFANAAADQPSRFKLNHSTNTKGSTADHALWVGDLSADVDDYGLYKVPAMMK